MIHNGLAADRGLMQLRLLRMTWWALFLSQAIYFGVAAILSQVGPPGRPAQAAPWDLTQLGDPAALMIGIMGLSLAGVAIYLPKALLASQARKHFEQMSGRPLELFEVTRMTLPAYLVRWALLELVTVHGFILAYLKSDVRQMIPFFAAATVLFALNYPSEDKLRRALTTHPTHPTHPMM